MDRPIDISKLCLDKLKKIKSTDKYENIKQCVNIYPKKIQKETKSKVIGDKCRAYLQKQANTTRKVTKTQLNQNCDVIAQVQDKAKGGKGKQPKGRRGRGGRGNTVNDKKLLEQNKPTLPAPPKELNSTEKRIKDLEIEYGKHALMGNEEKAKETLEKMKETYCGETAKIGYNVIAGTFTAIFNSFEKGKLPSVGWDNGKYLLGQDIGTALKTIIGCLGDKVIGSSVGSGILAWIGNKVGIWRGSGNPTRRGNPPDNPDFGGGGGGGDDKPPRPPRPPDKKDEEEEQPRRTAPPSTQLQPQGQAQPTTADVLLAQQRQQRTQAYQAQATAQSKALEDEIAQSSQRDNELMERKGLVNTPQGIMTREQWEQFKKGEQALQEEDKKQGASWSDVFTDIAEDIGKGVAVAGGLSIPLASVANILRGQQGGLTAEQARQANIDFANEPPFPQEGQPRQPRQPQAQRGQGQETGAEGQPRERPAEAERGEGLSAEGEPKKKDSPPRQPRERPKSIGGFGGGIGWGALAGLGAGAMLGGGRGKTREGALLGALGATSLFRPQTEGGEAVSLEEDMISRAVEGSMLGARAEEGGEKPRATYLRPRQLSQEEAEQRLEDIGQPAQQEEEEAVDRSLAEYHRDWEARMRGRIRSRTAEMLLGGTRNPVDRMLSEAEETRADTDRALEELGAIQAREAVGARPQYLDEYMGGFGGILERETQAPPQMPEGAEEEFFTTRLPSGEIVGMEGSVARARQQITQDPYSPDSMLDIEALERFEDAVRKGGKD